ncbi:DUF922 domain-containing protein [Spirosoma rhododendri]|uniref:DUF922 domain-containing protein n=1 Tax=Spirosoma rhododendri TaxID=2728024 RepID=A0A7L5DLG6_9BACT|nr:hypothetical protein [Spirosoma rhododendri]QJD78361.1 hypothetical protein HH216_07930 [Spirosoma rhododendri]
MLSLLSFFWLFIELFSANAVDPIRLQPAQLPFTPTGFYISTVTDQRTERGPAIRLVVAPDQSAQAVDLAGGLTGGIREFVNRSLRNDQKLRPIAMRLVQFKLTETSSGNRVSGQFAATIAFDLIGKNDDDSEISTRLTTYRGGASYTRPMGQTAVVEQTIRQSLTASLRSLNEYMKREIDRNEKLATTLRVEFADDARSTDDDTVHYNPDRPLSWADFQARPRSGSHYAAEVFTSFAYEGRSTVEHGTITAHLLVKAYMLKHSSWVRDVALNAYSLNHEQRHFDIAKLIAERFKRKLTPETLTLADYNSEIQYQFIESFRDMNKLQEQYDRETQHGINQAAQAFWNQKIDAELRSYGLAR